MSNNPPEQGHDETITFDIIGEVSSPYKEKFAIPRQPGLVKAAKGKITLLDDANNIDLLRGIEEYSHIWVIFIFHATQQQGWKPLVRPPRLGGNKKLGVFATRSTFRPNPIGMSVVKLDKIELNNKRVELNISGLDLLDHTPVIDIKPYIPYSDSIINAHAGFAQQAPSKLLTVTFSSQATKVIQANKKDTPDLETLICQVLGQDPRPAYKQLTTKRASIDTKVYGISLYHFNIKWCLITDTKIEVIEII
ncbi:tRNA (N6-threonylcarbamoyladenosine(37)-N6)-methyltransferase TrmO [Colwelliaceae bacterium 6441]